MGEGGPGKVGVGGSQGPSRLTPPPPAMIPTSTPPEMTRRTNLPAPWSSWRTTSTTWSARPCPLPTRRKTSSPSRWAGAQRALACCLTGSHLLPGVGVGPMTSLPSVTSASTEGQYGLLGLPKREASLLISRGWVAGHCQEPHPLPASLSYLPHHSLLFRLLFLSNHWGGAAPVWDPWFHVQAAPLS